MANEENNNDLKKAGGYLKEKLAIGLTRWNDDELERAVLKVTSHKLKAPNEKHMARLLAATFGSFNPGKNSYDNQNRYIVTELEKKTHVHNWIVLLKTLVVLHKLMKEGSNEINAEIQVNRNLFCMRHMKDVADSPEGAVQASFITQYTRYLEERSLAQTTLRLSFRIESTEDMNAAIDAMTLEQRTVTVDALLMQMDVLSQIDFRENAVDNFATLDAFKMLGDDGKRLYVILTKAVMYIIDRFLDLSPQMKTTWIKLYARYAKSVASLKLLFQSMNESRTVVFEERYPELAEMPPSVLIELEELAKPPVAVVPLSSIVKSSGAAGSPAGGASAAAAAAAGGAAVRTISLTAPAAATPAVVVIAPPPPVAVETHKQQLDLFQDFGKGAASSGPTFDGAGAAAKIPMPDFGSPLKPATTAQTTTTTGGGGVLDDIFAPVAAPTRPPAAAPASSAQPVAAAGGLPPKHDTLSDIFAPVAATSHPPPAPSAPPVVFAPATAAPAAAVPDFFGTSAPPAPARVTTVAPSQPTPAAGGFDPFAAVMADATKPAAAAKAAPIDFFAVPTSTTAHHGAPAPSQPPSHPVLTSDGRTRAW